MSPVAPDTNPVEGTVTWNPSKSLWYLSHLMIGVVGGVALFSWSALVVCGFLTVVTLCCGHTVGLHRLLIHRNLRCPLWLERWLVYLGTLVGMGGPLAMIYLHDIRDWAQRYPQSHAFFIHGKSITQDYWWNLNCGIELKNPPEFVIEPEVKKDKVYRFLQLTWMWQQVPIGVLLFLAGGWPWVVFGVSLRIFISLTGHWLIGYFAHNAGQRTWYLRGHAVQGFNLPHLGILTMGECWHNNHHAFPESARLGIAKGQADPGWWVVQALRRAGLAWEVRVPEDLPERPERELLVNGATQEAVA